MIDKVLAYLDTHRDRHVELLHDFLRIPCISTDPARAADMKRAADWVRQRLSDCGLQAEVVATAGHPAVLADSGPVEGSGPTVLIYGHYDVQPAGDESLWHSPPFEPTVREGQVFARGAADDKGQLLLHVLAAEAWMKTAGRLPIRVKYLIEGEEEIGSPHLGDLVREHRERLACDYVVLSDTGKLDAETPAITYGTKGMVFKEILVSGPKQDLHSGQFGGTLRNPGNALAAILAGLRNADETVAIPGFYDDVRPISDAERASIAKLPFDEEAYLESVGSPGLAGEAGYSTMERQFARPTLDVNGLFGGFMGQGASTIIPARVGAKVSMRLVPDQEPDKVAELFDRAVEALSPDGVRVEVRTLAKAGAYVCPLDSPGMAAAIEAVEAGAGKRPALIRAGGTLPILPLFREVLGAESIMMGFCDPNCNAHGPNEFFGLGDLKDGSRSAACVLEAMARRAG